MENTVREQLPEDDRNETPANSETTESTGGKRRFGLQASDAGKYIRYVVFLVVIGLVYIWNSHVAEKQVRRENKLKKEIADAKAEYKTMHARLSAGTRLPVIAAKVDSIGLKATKENTWQLKK